MQLQVNDLQPIARETMNTLTDRLNAQARINPIREENRVKEVMKRENGNLFVKLHGGRIFEIDKNDELFQAFVVYTVLAEV